MKPAVPALAAILLAIAVAIAGVATPAAANGVTITQDAAQDAVQDGARDGMEDEPREATQDGVTDGAAAAAGSGGRYAMRSTADGTIRLDTRTGETTLCVTEGGKLRCELAAEEREAYEREIDALGSRLEALEQRVIALEAPQETADDPTRDDLTQAERDQVDRAVSMAERAMRGFAGAVKRLKRALETE